MSYKTLFEANKAEGQADVAKIEPMEISMDPGAGAGVKGEYLQPASFFESLKGLIFSDKSL